MTHYEKIKLAGIKKYGSEEAWRKHMSEIGRKGGKSGKGASKIRGDRNYYSEIGRKGVKSRIKT